jgi:hypothetical protein
MISLFCLFAVSCFFFIYCASLAIGDSFFLHFLLARDVYRDASAYLLPWMFALLASALSQQMAVNLEISGLFSVITKLLSVGSVASLVFVVCCTLLFNMHVGIASTSVVDFVVVIFMWIELRRHSLSNNSRAIVGG